MGLSLIHISSFNFLRSRVAGTSLSADFKLFLMLTVYFCCAEAENVAAKAIKMQIVFLFMFVSLVSYFIVVEQRLLQR